MDKPGLPYLRTDKEFKNLIRPLQRGEYLQLEQNLMEDGCIDPIITWNGVIIDGHNRYEICHNHNIPFRTVEMQFECREAAIAWICAHQLGRRNITDETRKFLIGMQYESEKIVNNKRNAQGVNQYTYSGSVEDLPPLPASNDEAVPSKHKTAVRIGDEHHISWNTVNKYAAYTRALETIGQKVPNVVPRILSGRYKISHDNVLSMAELTPDQIRIVISRIEETQAPFVQYKRTRQELQNASFEDPPELLAPGPTIKDMPKFDPDAELVSLALTVPSWVSSMNRAKDKTDFSIATQSAKQKLNDSLYVLAQSIQKMLTALKED